MRYSVTHTTKYSYGQPAALSHNLVRLLPRELATQSVDGFRLVVMPEPADLVFRIDAFGNRVDYFSIPHTHSGLTLTASSIVTRVPAESNAKTTLAWEDVRESLRRHDLPDQAEALRYAFPSAHTPDEPDLRAYAATSFPPGRQTLEAALDLTTRIYTDFEYDPTATTVSTPVLEAFRARAGVCQDFAHLQIAMLRSLGLAARYVSGYLRTKPPEGKPRLVGADATHAWLSVYCGKGRWVDLDPTNDCVPGSDHITLAIGRDYGDVAPVQGVFVGGGAHSLQVSVDVVETENSA